MAVKAVEPKILPPENWVITKVESGVPFVLKRNKVFPATSTLPSG
jgi:hypothetical protein